MPHKSLIRKYVTTLFLLTLFAGYLACIFGFSHVHVMDGVRIVHSHPYQDGHQKSGHTQVELDLISEIGHFIADEPYVASFEFTPSLRLEAISMPHSLYGCLADAEGCISLRAPPCL